MIKKLAFAFFALIFMTGFTVDYDIKINDGKIIEEFTVIENDLNTAKEENEIGESFEEMARIYGTEFDLLTSFNELYSDNRCSLDCSFYEKKYINENNHVGFTLSHEFSYEDYEDSTLANDFLPEFKSTYDDNYFSINTGSSWEFINGYKNLDKLTISIETDYNVTSTNSNNQSNTYSWEINRENLQNVGELYIVFERNPKIKTVEKSDNNTLLYLIIITIALIVFLIGYVLYKKKEE